MGILQEHLLPEHSHEAQRRIATRTGFAMVGKIQHGESTKLSRKTVEHHRPAVLPRVRPVGRSLYNDRS